MGCMVPASVLKEALDLGFEFPGNLFILSLLGLLKIVIRLVLDNVQYDDTNSLFDSVLPYELYLGLKSSQSIKVCELRSTINVIYTDIKRSSLLCLLLRKLS